MVLSEPKTNMSEVLWMLIMNGQCCGMDFSFVDYRKRLSTLKLDHGIIFDSIPTPFVNKRGRKGMRSNYVLRTTPEQAKLIYDKINGI